MSRHRPGPQTNHSTRAAMFLIECSWCISKKYCRVPVQRWCTLANADVFNCISVQSVSRVVEQLSYPFGCSLGASVGVGLKLRPKLKSRVCHCQHMCVIVRICALNAKWLSSWSSVLFGTAGGDNGSRKDGSIEVFIRNTFNDGNDLVQYLCKVRECNLVILII